MKRKIHYDKELAKASMTFANGSEARIERLLFYEHGWQEGICLSWWDGNRMMADPLDGTDDEILLLLANGLQTPGVFSECFLSAVRELLWGKIPRAGRTIELRCKTPYAEELARASARLSDSSEGRIERLLFGEDSWYNGQEGIRFSWWKGKNFKKWPLGVTENELLALLKSALQQDVFPADFMDALRKILPAIS